MSTTDNDTEKNDAVEETTENTDEEDKIALTEYITNLEARIKQKTDMRNSNLSCVRPPENYFSKLDSGLKKNTTFVKKLKSFSAIQLDTLMKDFSALNLTKYISEVAAAIAEAKLKMSDIPAAINLCSALHRTYSEFSSNFFENWQKLLKITDKITNSSKLRVDIRFYAELVAVGVFPNKIGLPLLGNVLTVLINMDKDEPNNIPILLSFCKHCGEDYAGLVPKKIKDTAEKLNITIPRNPFLPAEKQAVVRTLLRDYFATLSRHLMEERAQLQALHAANQRTLRTRGELSQERREQLEQHQATYDKLLVGAQSFAEVLGEELGEAGEPPTLSLTVIETPGTVTIGGTEEFNMQAGTDPWQDEDTRTFYTTLPDLKVFMPNYQPKEATKSKPETVTEEMLDEELKEDELSDGEEPAAPDVEPDDAQPASVSNKYALDAFLNELPNCINRELIDNAAVDFVLNLNTKNNRKKLTRVLFSVARTRLDLLPFYSRFAANLYPVLPDVCMDLCQMLKQDFKYHVRKKDQINIESKIKVVRFIGELVKFALYSKMEALYCLKVLLHDFKHHHIEMACNLLETCGRYLYCNPDTHQRTMIYLQQMMRKKTVSALDSRYVTQIENAFYYVCPPEAPAQPKEEEPPMFQFIRKILHEDLQKSNEEKIFRLMRKINWDDPDIAAAAIQHLAGGWRVRASARRALARLTAELAAWQEAAAPAVVDTVLEEIRFTMEDPHPRHNQRRIATVRYLGELYNYKLLDSRDVFNVLYSFITFGVTNDHSTVSPLDPPDSVFRIRLVCALLETCGAYFNSGSSKKRLDYFLVFFQNYYWFKCSDPCWTEENKFPIYVKYIYQECLTTLRPKLTLFTDWQQCKDAIEDLRLTLYPELGEDDQYDNEDMGDDSVNDGLDTIVETDDETDNPQLMDESSDDEPLTETAGNDDNEVQSDDMSNEPRRPAYKPMSIGDGLPVLICKSCEKNVRNFYNFKQKCLHVDTKLRTMKNCSFSPNKPNPDDPNLDNMKMDVKLECELLKLSGDLNNSFDSWLSDDVDAEFCSQYFNKLSFFKTDETKPILGQTNELTTNDSKIQINKKPRHRRKKSVSSYKIYQCEICGRIVRNKSVLAKHMVTHSGIKQFSCKLCPKTFTRAEHKVIHMRTHLGIKPYICEVCGRSFTKRQDLVRHMKIHSDEKKFKCLRCDKQFKRSGDVHSHMRTHTGARPYNCSNCNKTYSSHSGLRKHYNAHCKKEATRIEQEN